MKQKLIAILILIFASFLLVGCDFFGGEDTTTTTTTTTTQAPTTTETPTTKEAETTTTEEHVTTEVPTTEATTTVEVTTSQDVYFTVVFYDGDGSVFDTQSVLEGTPANGPGVPTRAATAQYTYTFDAWDQDFSNVLANMNIFPVFTETLNLYTVNFFDGDGTLIEAQPVGYGLGATAPQQIPVKADVGADTFIFDGWDVSFSNITGNLDVNPTFTIEFNRNALVQMVNMMFDPSDPEEVITEMLLIMEVATEEDLYYMMDDMWGLYQELFSIRSGTELQTWYAATKAAGFDETLYSASLYNAMTIGMTNDLNWATQEVADLTVRLAEKVALLDAAEAAILALETEVTNYCLTGVPVGLEADCQTYWDTMLEAYELENQYWEQLDQATWDNWEFDWNFYNYVKDLKDGIIYQDIVMENPVEVSRLQGLLDDALGELSQEGYDLYSPLLDSLELFRSIQYVLYETDTWIHLNVMDLSGTVRIDYHLSDLAWGDNFNFTDDDIHYYGYIYYLKEINDYTWSVVKIEENLERAEDRLAELTVTVGFLTDPMYEQNFIDLMGDAYEALDAVILTVDDATVDMILDFAMDFLYQSMSFRRDDSVYYYDELDFYDEGPDFDFMQFITAENIEWVASRLDTTLLAVLGTLDVSDFDNAKVLLLGFLEAQLTAEGLDPLTEVAPMIVEYGDMFDKYVDYFNFFTGNLSSLLGSIDTVKASAFVELFEASLPGMKTEIDITILVSKAYEIVNGDDSFDVATFIEYVTDIYLDVNVVFNPDETERATILSGINLYVTQFTTLIETVSAYNPNHLTIGEMEYVSWLMAYAMNVPAIVESDFATLSDAVPPYQGDYVFENLSWEFLNGALDQADTIALFQMIFGTVDNDGTYYTLRVIQQYILGFTTTTNFDELQEWMGGLETFGFTQAEIVGYLMGYLDWYVTEFKDGTPEFLDELSWLEGEIQYWQARMDDKIAYLDDIEVMVDGFVQAFEPMYQTVAADYWLAMKDGVELNFETSWRENVLRWEIDGNEVDYLIGILNDIDMYESEPSELAIAEAAYVDFLANYSEDTYIAEIITTFRPLYIENINYFDDVINPLLEILDDADYDAYIDFLNYTNNIIMDYEECINDLNWFEWEIVQYEEQIDRLYEDLYLLDFIYDFLEAGTNYTDSEIVANLLLDDLQNMVAMMPAGSFELVEEVVKFAMMMENYRGEISLDDLPFTAAEIYTFTQDLSALLKLRADTLDTTDLDVLEAFILTIITEIIEDDDDIASIDKPAEVIRINALILKYIGFADDTLTEFTIMLDGLAEADIQKLFDTIAAFTEGGYSVYQMVVLVAQTVDGLYDPALVDLDLIVDMLLEVYFDMEFETYDPQDLADTQIAWNVYIAETEMVIAVVAGYDLMAIDPANYPDLIELQEAVMYLGMMFEDPMYILSDPFVPSTFDIMVLNDIVSELFDEYDPAAVTALQDKFIDILGLTAGDYEALYYEFIGIAEIAMGIDRIESPDDIFAVYQAIKGLGYTNADLAGIATDVLIEFLYPQLMYMTDTTWIQDEIDNLQADLDDYLDQIATIQLEVQAEIALIDMMSYPGATIDAGILWDAMLEERATYAAFDTAINMYSWESEYFDWGLWDEIQMAFNDEEWSYLDDIFYYMDMEEYDMYQEILDCYEAWVNAEAYLMMIADQFQTNYPGISTSFDPGYMLPDYLFSRSDELSWLYMDIWDVEYQLMELETELEAALAMAWIPETIELFLSDAANEVLVEDLIIVFLDQFEAWSMDPNFEVFSYIEMLIKMGPNELSITDISTNIQMVGSLLTGMLGTIDTTDEGLLIAFAIAVADAYATTVLDPVQAEIFSAKFEMIIIEILPEILEIPETVGNFLLSFDETKTEETFFSVIEMFIIFPMDPNGEVRETINIAVIMDVILGDMSLDYEALISPAVKIMYEAMVISGMPPLTFNDEDTIDEIVVGIDDILMYAAIVAGYDPANMTEAQLEGIDDFFMSIENLIMYIQSLGMPV